MANINTIKVGSTDYDLKDKTKYCARRDSLLYYATNTATTTSNLTTSERAVMPWTSENGNFRVIAGMYSNYHSDGTSECGNYFADFTKTGSQGNANQKKYFGIQVKQAGTYLLNYSLTGRSQKSGGEQVCLLDMTTSGYINGPMDQNKFTTVIYYSTSIADVRTYGRSSYATLSANQVIGFGSDSTPGSDSYGTLYLYNGYHSMSIAHLN